MKLNLRPLSIAALLLCTLFLSGCLTDNVSTSKFLYTDPGTGASVRVEMPKEVHAKNMKVSIDAKNGTANITADEWVTTNLEAIKAQGQALKEVAASATKAGVEAAATALMPKP